MPPSPASAPGAPPRRPPPDAPANLRVAIFHDWLNGMRGGEKCLEAMLEVFPRAEVFTLVHQPERLSACLRAVRVHEHPLARLPGFRRGYRSLIPLFPLLVRGWPEPAGFDLAVSSSHCVAKGMAAAGLPHFCYCYSPMRYVWDRYDDYFGPGRASLPKRAAMRLLRRPLQAWDRRTSRSVHAFAAISGFVRRRIQDCYGRDSAVVHPFADTEFYTPDPAAAREDFYLVVSALVPYKRVDLAVATARLLGRRLVVVGEGPERARLAAAAGPQLEFLGWRPDAEIRDLYRRCRALLFPGVEDFGIVPVEAMACGAPVLAYHEGGAAETVDRPEGGILFREQTAESLAQAMRTLEAGPGRWQPAGARALAERFSRARFLADFRREALTVLT